MKLVPLFVLAFLFIPRAMQAQPSPGIIGEGETNWTGVNYQIFTLQRIPPNRLLVGVRLLATAKASLKGTLVGYSIPTPVNADKYAVMAGLYHPRPFSLVSSVMTDELTKQPYQVLPPVSPPGRKYIPSEALASLRPGQNVIFTVQFAIPPPPPATVVPAKQTLSFMFTNAKSPITGIPLPPPITAAGN